VCKTLKQEDIKEKAIENIISKTIEWIEQAQEDFEFVRPLFNLFVEKTNTRTMHRNILHYEQKM